MTTPRVALYYDIMPSPLGPLTLVADDAGLCEICFESEHRPNTKDTWQRDAGRLAKARTQLAEYFAGRRTVFDLPLHPRGTPFQLAVWEELLRIPFGITMSYGELAQRIGKPKAVRAVGAANGRNPIPIIVPCHRVIGADHSLTGYGGGLWIKRALLGLEGRKLHGDLFVEPAQ
ncbi:MAG: methylated-DNA--[protein]-cysteine S-methyltransferase [Rhodanobacter sp.]|nr:MAG: methylated-DNA--[protein]-cysteine S-methyltransferase [Rhodanobacter sp.]TAM12509.1 MAG: methylated-DNA--[protein]-cysteine S-methyltransferase [Rhodanobacter sp.]TAM34511.1 MAG: methylated-DNA--[protein]-cysteine S-methyltransferase [Rhodanobacter sp.]